MNIFNNPTKEQWESIIERPQLKKVQLEQTVASVFEDVKRNKDIAVKKYTRIFDNFSEESFLVSSEEFEKAKNSVSKELKEAIAIASMNITKFHKSQKRTKTVIETQQGVYCWQETRAIDKVGLYIPGGSAPLFSTVLMLGIPAKLAGCEEIVLCSPADSQGEINPVILYTAQSLGIEKVYKLGGIQAIAAMTYGTEEIPSVYKIFGPGNQFVTAAKQYALNQGIAIDMPAGPSEVLVMSDENADPGFIASDLLAQAEHGPDSQVILTVPNQEKLNDVLEQIKIQKSSLERLEIVDRALSHARYLIFDKVEDQLSFSNFYGPEHLIINRLDAEDLLFKVQTAGSVFIGAYSPESLGDYASGTNHTLPTNKAARAYSGVSLESFQKTISFQKISARGIQNLGPSVELMAEAEGLEAHKNAVSIRLKSLKK